jgi:exonuclease III
VLSLYRSHALRNPIDFIQTCKVDIVAVQEVRWTRQSIFEKKECTVYYSCHKSIHQFGTGFIDRKKIRDLVIDFQPINMRICKLRLKGSFQNYSLISAHAPTEEKNESKKDAFYDTLERTYENCS